MNHKFSLSQTPFLLTSGLLLMSAFLLSSIAFAENQTEILIKVESEDVHVETMDISHLSTGDVETIYSEDGKTIDVMKTDTGIEIFIDGEKIELPSLDLNSSHEDSHKVKHITVSIHCESEADDDCEEDEKWLLDSDGDLQDHEDLSHRIIIKKI